MFFRRDLLKYIVTAIATPFAWKKSFDEYSDFHKETVEIVTQDCLNGGFDPKEIANPEEKLEYEYRIERLMDQRMDLDLFQMAALQRAGYLIEHIQNPNEHLQLIAVHHNGTNLRHIKNPTQKVCEEAVFKNGQALQFVKAELQNDAMQRYAAGKDGTFIRYAINPSEEIQIIAVTKTPNALQYIEKPSETVVWAAVSKSINALKNCSDKIPVSMHLDLVKKYPHALKFLTNHCTNEVKMAAVAAYGGNLRYIKKPTQELELSAIKSFPAAIQFVKNPTIEMQLCAMNANAFCIVHIHKPCEEALGIAKKENLIQGEWGWYWCDSYVTHEMANQRKKDMA